MALFLLLGIFLDDVDACGYVLLAWFEYAIECDSEESERVSWQVVAVWLIGSSDVVPVGEVV